MRKKKREGASAEQTIYEKQNGNNIERAKTENLPWKVSLALRKAAFTELKLMLD